MVWDWASFFIGFTTCIGLQVFVGVLAYMILDASSWRG